MTNTSQTELKTSEQWYAEQDEVTIVDPDGWRHKDLPSNYWSEVPITKEEFNGRLAECTVFWRPAK